jgi:hypothetical protein
LVAATAGVVLVVVVDGDVGGGGCGGRPSVDVVVAKFFLMFGDFPR